MVRNSGGSCRRRWKIGPDITQQELAVNVFKDPASVSRILDLLIEKGFLTREPDPADRRRFRLTITQVGLEPVDDDQTKIELRKNSRGRRGGVRRRTGAYPRTGSQCKIIAPVC